MKTKADQVIEGCLSLAKHYASDDPQRWPFIVGVMTVKIRELTFLLEQRDSEITNLCKQLELKESNND